MAPTVSGVITGQFTEAEAGRNVRPREPDCGLGGRRPNALGRLCPYVTTERTSA